MHCVPLTQKVNSVFVELGYSVTVDKIKVIEPWLKVLWSFRMILLHILKRVASTERETPFYLKEQFTQKCPRHDSNCYSLIIFRSHLCFCIFKLTHCTSVVNTWYSRNDYAHKLFLVVNGHFLISNQFPIFFLIKNLNDVSLLK